MLVRRQPERALVHLGQLLQTGLEVAPGLILDTTVLDEHHEVVPAILALVPAEVIDVAIEAVGACGFKGISEKLLNLGLVVVQP